MNGHVSTAQLTMIHWLQSRGYFENIRIYDFIREN